MPTKVFIFGEGSLWSYHRSRASDIDLSYDLNNFLQDRGEVIWDGDEHRGPRWNVDILLHENADDIDGWIQRLTGFLREWGVSDRTVSFTIIREGATPECEHRRVDLASP